MKKTLILLIVSFTLLIIGTVVFAANSGSMDFSMGYTLIDDMDNPSVNQETFNYYEGFGVSIDNLMYRTDNGLNFNGNFYHTTMNNRNMTANLYKAGLFELSFFNNQYRRIYSSDGSKYTHRQTTGIKGSLQPAKNFKLHSGFKYSDRDGTAVYTYHPIYFEDVHTVNFMTASYNIGAEAFNENGRISFDYKKYISQDDAAPGYMYDRKADQYNLTFNTHLPSHEEVQLFGGYISREDKMDSLAANLKTTNTWGALRYYFGDQFTFNYRFIVTSTKHKPDVITTDNTYHTASIQKAWKRIGGIRLGYEIRKSDNDIIKTTTNGFFSDAWYNYNDLWYFRGRYTKYSREMDKGYILSGDRDKSLYLFSVKYTIKNYGSMSAKIEKRIKEYNDLYQLEEGYRSSKADYTKASSKLTLKEKSLGKLIFAYSYYVGKFEDISNTTTYEFSDNILSAWIIPNEIGPVAVSSGASYYRSRRDVDVEKFNYTGKIDWTFIPEHHLVAEYKLFTFDDFLVSANTYTSNIVEIKFIKNLTF